MERERISNSLPPPQTPAEKAKLLLAENNARILAIQQGKDLAIETLEQIDLFSKLIRRFVPSFGPILVKYHNTTLIPATSRHEEMPNILEAEFDPHSIQESSNDNSMVNVADGHKRRAVLIELGFQLTKEQSGSRFTIPWKKRFDRRGKILYFFAPTNRPDAFLTLTPENAGQGEIWLAEDLTVAQNEKAFHDFWQATLKNKAPHGSRDMVGLEPVAA